MWCFFIPGIVHDYLCLVIKQKYLALLSIGIIIFVLLSYTLFKSIEPLEGLKLKKKINLKILKSFSSYLVIYIYLVFSPRGEDGRLLRTDPAKTSLFEGGCIFRNEKTDNSAFDVEENRKYWDNILNKEVKKEGFTHNFPNVLFTVLFGLIVLDRSLWQACLDVFASAAKIKVSGWELQMLVSTWYLI